MDFLDKLGETLTTVGRDVTNKAKDLTGVAKINLDLKGKEDLLQKKYTALGNKYYHERKNSNEMVTKDFMEITNLLNEIEKLKEELLIAKGAKICANCGEKMPETAEFCSSCGAQLDIFIKSE